jgi:uncharacterized hydrophobic protein (TIGR00271 family)
MQHRVATALGVDETARADTVVAMLRNNRRSAPGYWIQLGLAMGIATVGLVLNSTAVVIGAMLVSPLMGPIVELGMGFAVGSPLLTLRAALRVLLSVLIVVAGAALLTLALPFHEVTPEIAARTAPTALDLLVAIFCALTAAYTTVRPASDTTSAAAGTAIGIALVPPLCVTGIGLGTGAGNVASGAALLFTANFSAILVLAVLSFLLLGYNQVALDAIEPERNVDGRTRTDRLAARAERGLRRAFGSRYGLVVRVIIPLVFLAAVFVPLLHALDEVTWEVRARAAIRRILDTEAPRAVQTAVSVERHAVTLHLVLVATDEQAAALERLLRTTIDSSTGVVPSITVTAVPDARTLAAAALNRGSNADAPGDRIDVATIRQRIASAIDAEWPAAAAGVLAGWDFVVGSRDTATVVVHHIGAPLGPAGAALLANRWSSAVGAPVEVRDDALAHGDTAVALGREHQWYAAAGPLLHWVAAAHGANACVKAPTDTSRRRSQVQQSLIDSIQHSTAARAGRVALSDSAGWRIHVTTNRCS